MKNLLSAHPTSATQLLRALRRFPERTAFAWDSETLSYRATADLIGGMQAVYAAAGLQRGDRVCLLTSNLAAGWCAGMAAMASGMAITWLHPMGSFQDQLYQLNDFGTQVLIVDAGVHRARGGELASAATDRITVFTLGQADYGQDLLHAVQRVGSSTPRDLSKATDIGIVNYTGGTTGRSKGAVRSNGCVAASTVNILSDFELPARPGYLAVAPITHVAGSKILPVLMRGGTVHLMNGFAPDRLFDTIARERINMTLLVPTMIYALLDHPALDRADLSSLELLLYGASPMSSHRLIEGMERIGPVFAQLYGQTEGYPLAVLGRADHDARHPELFASCGLPTAGTTLCLLDDDGQEVAMGEVGELCAQGAQVMQRYHNLPELSDETLKGGWLHTGDMARADERGYLYIVDRKKDMVISGGFNIYPRDVEEALGGHPDVAMVAVIGVPDAKWGEAVMALVQRRPGATVTDDELIQRVKAQKGSLHAPKRVEFVDVLPLTGLGKVDKKALRARYWEGHDRQVG